MIFLATGSSTTTTPISLNTLILWLRNDTSDSTLVAELLSQYIAEISDPSASFSNLLTVDEIDQLVLNLDSSNLSISTNTSFIMSYDPFFNSYNTIQGAIYNRRSSGQTLIINNGSLLNTNISAGAEFPLLSLTGIERINLLIIDRSPVFDTLDRSRNQTLVSSVIVAGLRRNSSRNVPMNISLYFQVLDEYRASVGNGTYQCSWFDFSTSLWSAINCSAPIFNNAFNRFECLCTHLSTYALIYSPTLCTNSNETLSVNGTCLPKIEAQASLTSFSNLSHNRAPSSRLMLSIHCGTPRTVR